MRLFLFPAVCVLLLCGCSRSPFKGYKRVAEDVYFRLLVLGETERMATDSDSVMMRVRAARMGSAPGSLFSTERWYALKDSASGFVHQVIGRMRVGDSASVVVRGARVPWMRLGAGDMHAQDTAWVVMELSMRSVRTPMGSRALAVERRLLSRTAADEERDINSFLERSTEEWQTSMEVRYILEKSLHKEPIHSGDVVTIAYKASFVADGHVFDDTYRSGQPLTFRLGDPGQVIKGLEVAMHVLWKGGKGRFLIPSALAFGEQGSTSGIVPPHMPVLYEVEVIAVAGRPIMPADSSTAVR